jgi:hypothetical protein
MKEKKVKQTIEERELLETGDTGLDFIAIFKEVLIK